MQEPMLSFESCHVQPRADQRVQEPSGKLHQERMHVSDATTEVNGNSSGVLNEPEKHRDRSLRGVMMHRELEE